MFELFFTRLACALIPGRRRRREARKFLLRHSNAELHKKVDHLHAMLAAIHPVEEAQPARGAAKEVQEAGLGTLLEIDGICRQHGLRYWLEGGTLLGAIRHQGFIPWDDDIDISMPFEDRTKLIKILKAQAYEDEYSIYERPSPKGTLKVCKRSFAIGTRNVKKLRKRDQYDGGKMLYPCIDIFSFDEDSAALRWTPNFSSTLTYELKNCDLFPLKETMFEGHAVLVPQKCEVVLRKTYGANYYSWPPLDAMWSHDPQVDWFEIDEADDARPLRSKAA